MTDVQTEIKEIIQKYTEKDLKDGDISLIEDLEFDSLQLVEVLAEIEERFQISFEESEKMLDLVDHLEQLINYVEELGQR